MKNHLRPSLPSVSSLGNRPRLAIRYSLLATFACCCAALSAAEKPKVLFFTKSSAFQHPIIKSVDGKPSQAMAHMDKIAAALGIQIIESKDGTLISPQNLRNYAAVVFYTSGDLSKINDKTDNAPAVSPAGKQALLDAVASGKLGYVGIHAASDCYHTPGNREAPNGDATDPYLKMLGGEFIAHDWQEFALIRNTDPAFPGNTFPAQSQLKNEWYSFKNLAPDLHVLLTLDGPGGKMVGPHYQRPVFPVAWTRAHGKGRVFYTALGHGRESWDDPRFISQLQGGIEWALGRTHPDVTPNIAQITPAANTLAPVTKPPYRDPSGNIYTDPKTGKPSKLPIPSPTPPKLN
jgi:type 1 glutamine amidotransferase